MLLTLHVELAQAGDADAIRRLLGAADLPVDDLVGRTLDHFLVVRDGAHVVGTVGVDFAGNAALLRSLAVAPSARTRGLGRELVAAAENLAWQRGAEALYLLTTTAQDYFLRRGYRLAQRSEAPSGIAAMPQFASLCPSSSAFMIKARA